MWPGEPSGVSLAASVYWPLMYCSNSSFEMASLPLLFSSSSWRAYRKGSLKKVFLSVSFLFRRFLSLSARRSLASLCLRSAHNTLRPSFSSEAASLLLLFCSWRLSATSSSMYLSLRPFCLWAVALLALHSLILSLHSS